MGLLVLVSISLFLVLAQVAGSGTGTRERSSNPRVEPDTDTPNGPAVHSEASGQWTGRGSIGDLGNGGRCQPAPGMNPTGSWGEYVPAGPAPESCAGDHDQNRPPVPGDITYPAHLHPVTVELRPLRGRPSALRAFARLDVVAGMDFVFALGNRHALECPSRPAPHAISKATSEEARVGGLHLTPRTVAVKFLEPPNGGRYTLVRPPRESGTVHAVTPELVRMPESLLSVTPAEMNPHLSPFRLPDDPGGTRPELPVGTPADENGIDFPPGHAQQFEPVLGDEGHGQPEGADHRSPHCEQGERAGRVPDHIRTGDEPAPGMPGDPPKHVAEAARVETGERGVVGCPRLAGGPERGHPVPGGRDDESAKVWGVRVTAKGRGGSGDEQTHNRVRRWASQVENATPQPPAQPEMPPAVITNRSPQN